MQYYEKKVRKHLFFEGNIFFWLGRIDYFANYPYLCTMKTLLDVHTHTIASGIADYSNIMPLVEKADFPDELVLNYQPEIFMAYLKPTPEK